MPRKPRSLVDGGYYHLIARGNNRLFLFEIPEGFQTFKGLLKKSKGKYPWRLSHYCLMANHLHLLGQIEKGWNCPS
ncbi:MAG: transposase [Elusimicrobia bacterium]|nr:transposase [Elusimicrobiota bacterium]